MGAFISSNAIKTLISKKNLGVSAQSYENRILVTEEGTVFLQQVPLYFKQLPSYLQISALLKPLSQLYQLRNF